MELEIPFYLCFEMPCGTSQKQLLMLLLYCASCKLAFSFTLPSDRCLARCCVRTRGRTGRLHGLFDYSVKNTNNFKI